MLKSTIEFFRDPKNQHLATWIQTFSVVIGIIVALLQLSSVIDESKFKRNETYLKYESEFASDISRKSGLIYEYHVNRGRLSSDKYDELYPLNKFLEARESTESFISRLSACGMYHVCPSDHVDRFICAFSKSMHSTLSMKVEWPREWKIKFHEPLFYEHMISEHCSTIERLEFLLQRN